MTKSIIPFLFLVLFSGCDDGNLTQENINFDTATVQNCSTNDIIYKINKTEALLLEIPASTFTTEPSKVNSPTVLNIAGGNRVLYRFYNGNLNSDNICSTIPAATPVVTGQWTATDGKIQIVTTAIKTTNTTDNSSRITGYNHNIVFKNITFDRGNGTQVYETFSFGDYVKTVTPLPFSFDKTLDKCPTSNRIYNNTTGEALTLNIDPSLIKNEATPLNSPRTGLIGTTTNILNYRLFAGLLTPDYFCSATPPTSPIPSQEWFGMAGVADVSGQIEVTTTTNGPGSFKHTIVLKKATLTKGNNSFSLGDSFVYGELLTTN